MIEALFLSSLAIWFFPLVVLGWVALFWCIWKGYKAYSRSTGLDPATGKPWPKVTRAAR